MSNNFPNDDASFCNTIPLNNTNAIQPHGALLVVNVIDFSIIQISLNVCEWLGLAAEQILYQPLEKILEQKSADYVRDKYKRTLLKNVVTEFLTIIVDKNHKTYLARIHEQEHYVLIEVEFINEITAATKPFVNMYQQLQQIDLAIKQSNSIDALATVACREIKRISGFDKVMLYTFDEKWNGLVIGEEMEKGMESYRGLKFPATDIPKQARDLYLTNSYRLIPDRLYKKVGLIPELNPLTNSPTNLSDIKCRSVMGVHIEYLANMNVQASMSTRIIHNEALWGLIACHHRQAKFLSFEDCAIFEFMSTVISSKLSSLINQARVNERMRLNNLLGETSSKIFRFEGIMSALRNHGTEVMKLLGGDGVAFCWDNEIFTMGTTPKDHQIKELTRWLQAKNFKTVVDINSLPEAFELAKEYSEVASGVLVLPIQHYDGNFILAFKIEAVKTVSWGGNPDNAIIFVEGSNQYHPRNSFAVWKKTVRHTCNPWSEEELIAAERFRNVVVESALKKLTSTLEQKVNERTRELAVSKDNLSRALEELQELTNVASHDLQEPVRKIHVFATELDKPLEPAKRKEYIGKILKASNRISSLITDLVRISKVRRVRAFLKSDLQIIVDGVLKKLEPVIVENKVRVTAHNLPVIQAVPDQMVQLFTNIIDNAIKFRRGNVQNWVEIKAEMVSVPTLEAVGDKAGMFARISVADNGIGFNEEYADKLFRVFETLHPGEYEGNGTSLAVSKRIVESHRGSIFAQGKENQGAVFTVVLPVSQ